MTDYPTALRHYLDNHPQEPNQSNSDRWLKELTGSRISTFFFFLNGLLKNCLNTSLSLSSDWFSGHTAIKISLAVKQKVDLYQLGLYLKMYAFFCSFGLLTLLRGKKYISKLSSLQSQWDISPLIRIFKFFVSLLLWSIHLSLILLILPCIRSCRFSRSPLKHFPSPAQFSHSAAFHLYSPIKVFLLSQMCLLRRGLGMKAWEKGGESPGLLVWPHSWPSEQMYFLLPLPAFVAQPSGGSNTFFQVGYHERAGRDWRRGMGVGEVVPLGWEVPHHGCHSLHPGAHVTHVKRWKYVNIVWWYR